MSSDPRFEEGLRLILEAIEASRRDNDPPLSAQQMAHELRGFAALRGYPPRDPFLGAGRGRGARVMLADGRWILDFATPGNLFGHGNLDLTETAIRAAASDLVNQGGGAINREPYLLMKAIADHAPAGMTRCALAPSSGEAAAMVFELASHRRKCSGLIAFDNRHERILPATLYRLPGWNPADTESATATLKALRKVIASSAGEIAAMVAEPIDLETYGFHDMPHEFLTPLFDECRAAGIMVWIDESRTFARTPQLFATDHAGLANHADLITIGGAIEPAAILWRPYGKNDPVPSNDGTIGATVAIAVSLQIIEKLTAEGYLGISGRISRLEEMARGHLARLATESAAKISDIDGCGALLSFRIRGVDGSLAETRDFVTRCFRAGLLLDSTRRDPARVIVRLPSGDLTDPELADACRIIGDGLP